MVSNCNTAYRLAGNSCILHVQCIISSPFIVQVCMNASISSYVC